MNDILRFLIVVALFFVGTALFVVSLGAFADYFTNPNFHYVIIEGAGSIQGTIAFVVISIEFIISLVLLFAAYAIMRGRKTA